jgi:hypothetical protein
MKLIAILAAGGSLGLAGCATATDGDLIDRETRYRLRSVDGRPAGDRAFTISFDSSGAYRASFDCGEHFGGYALGPSLVLDPGATAPGACDEVDLATGRTSVRQESFGTQFLNDQPFTLRRRGTGIELRGRRHSYVLSR